MANDKVFMQLLRWKDSQHLLVFILDNDDENESFGTECNDNLVSNESTLIAPFWHRFNQIIQGLDDNINGKKYKGIALDENYWKQYKPKFNTSYNGIISELYFCTMQFLNMQEIIYQSNPESLHPIQFYSKPNEYVSVSTAHLLTFEHAKDNQCTSQCTSQRIFQAQSQSDLAPNQSGQWVISVDYLSIL